MYLTIFFFLSFVSVNGIEYDYESIEETQDDDLIFQQDIIQSLTDEDYFALPEEEQTDPEPLTKEDIHSLDQAEFYLSGMLDAIDGTALLENIDDTALLENVDDTALLDNVDDASLIDEFKDLEVNNAYIDLEEYELIEEAADIEEVVVQQPIENNHDDYSHFLSKVETKHDFDLFSDYDEAIPEETKEFVYFENISTEMKAMEITLSLIIFLGSTVLLVGGVLATMHLWRVVRPDTQPQLDNPGMKTIKLSGIVKSYSKIPADIRTMKNSAFAYQDLYETV